MSRANNNARDDRESVIQETATRVSTATATKVTETLNQQYGSVMSGLYHEIGGLEAQLQGQSGIQQKQLALNYAPSIDLVYAGDQLQIWNRGRTNIYLWGDKYDGGPLDFDGKSYIISPGTNYYILTNLLKANILSKLGQNGEARVPLDLYITTEDKTKYVVHAELWEIMKDDQLTIHTQNHAFEKTDWSTLH